MADFPPSDQSTELRLAKYARYNASEKGRGRQHRYNRTAKRMKAHQERNQVRRERAVHHAIVALATRRTA
jgi:hypothetical protein